MTARHTAAMENRSARSVTMSAPSAYATRARMAIAPNASADATMKAMPTSRVRRSRRSPLAVAMRSGRRWTLGALRTKRLAHGVVRLDVRSANEIEAVRNRREDARHGNASVGIAHAFECLADRLRLAGKVQHQRPAPNDAHLAREDRCRDEAERHLAHLLA